jgi:DNA repair exonuclease SbcCD nuclease subunit
MVRFIHTSDLHLGKRFGQFPEDLRGRLTEARHQSVVTLANLAHSNGTSFILVAGDIFDTGTPSPSVVRQALQAMATHSDVNWFLMPGNHDSLASDELWKQVALDRPKNVILGLECRPIEIEPAIFVLPAPSINRRPGRDLTEWMTEVELPDDCIRIALGHGAVKAFSEDEATDTIAPDRAQLSGLDYLALGDWHGQVAINDRTWYSGAPEPDRFKHNAPGKALLVSIESRHALPNVKALETGQFEWRNPVLHILSGEDPKSRLDQLLTEVSNRRNTLLQIAMEGRLRLPERLRLEEEFRRIGPDFAILIPLLDALENEYAIEDLTEIDQAGALRQAAEILMQDATCPSSDKYGLCAA